MSSTCLDTPPTADNTDDDTFPMIELIYDGYASQSARLYLVPWTPEKCKEDCCTDVDDKVDESVKTNL